MPHGSTEGALHTATSHAPFESIAGDTYQVQKGNVCFMFGALLHACVDEFPLRFAIASFMSSDMSSFDVTAG